MTFDLFYNKIQKVMQHCNWTQNDLAKASGISARTISRWMTDKTIPSTRTLRKIANCSGMSFRWLSDENYDGPMLQKAEWAFDVSLKKLTLQECAGIYERLNEIMEAEELNKSKLLKIANISTTKTDKNYYLGSPPNPRDIEKIANVTGYDKYWIWYGKGLRRGTRSGTPFADPSISDSEKADSGGEPEMDKDTQIRFLSRALARYEMRMEEIEAEIAELKKSNAGSK